MNQQQSINVKIDDKTLKGAYANNMQIAFSPEEFILDFMNLFPPQGIIVSRVFISPGHMKRMVAVLADTLKKYEAQHGQIKQASAPTHSEIGFRTE
ncbi:MAG: hypothetical protein A3I07_00680 [Candidatus Doudnabacteria bacterium RIFCSPLOWO2_02_FULL_42_9]|uniref:DUF3467 domain-containing protein n=1 Tax=Candidatus Doudnabacteria bacterium RIFCSPHIGHO2_01_FULL_41_86 TaxID=1817821 RepID=A0A1F5N9T1_9BACT|nr:MAG: hypothetical protein A2717_02690 [Candidatus Doudnabacteria bacterium RIFCSPHIGHO2_01_FULL_41_86]OGE75499.1 MAG: hypothetical protein A3K07_01020 [Candidatus Doudnabacteria bacterium RIFCSPHIGHO2_01_43_10]OGE85456.1 MAG: hypothetical protein A3E28_02260 [Candidatus Doudnabacteria bacterium RIFCSPHIGHO2_12_FULL_42_22]OGE86994.1 MAG: hypothetical protein A3C49_03095 [Candidatus Doudnabacteria bacterium RIFCSPHIGHO2_02_FULL_42_25]OGE92593.1 MAG: hypothetical protein A2895_03250 [Candidatus